MQGMFVHAVVCPYQFCWIIGKLKYLLEILRPFVRERTGKIYEENMRRFDFHRKPTVGNQPSNHQNIVGWKNIGGVNFGTNKTYKKIMGWIKCVH